MLCGTQGIGKTEAAKYYSHCRTDLDTVWLDCHSRDSLRMCLSEYLEKDNISGSIQNLEREAESLFGRLKGALIVFDDANDIEIQQWIARLPAGGCRYLVTTYYSSGAFMQEVKIPVERLDAGQGRRLFLGLLPEDRREQPLEALDQLTAFCGGLPLAIRQAAAYVGRTGISIKDFLENLQKEQLAGEAMDRDADGMLYSGKAHQGVYFTFKQTYDLIIQKAVDNRFYEVCNRILQYMAFLDPLCTSEEFFRSLDPAFDDGTLFNGAVLVAIGFGLLEREDGFKMRGVIQQVVRQLMTKEEQQGCLRAIAGQLGRQSLETVAAQRDFDVMLPVFIQMSYLQQLRGYELIREEEQIADLYCLAAEFLFVIGDYDECDKWYRRAGNTGGNLSGLRAWIGLALLYENRDDYIRAQEYIRKAEENEALSVAFRTAYPKDWLCYLEVKGYLDLGNDRLETALDYFGQSLEYLKGAPMGEHQKKYKEMLALNGMGMSYEKMGQFGMAEQYLKRALDTGNEAFRGYDKVPASMFMVIGNYGSLLSRTRRFDEAEKYLKEEEKLHENWAEEWKHGFAKKDQMRLWHYFFSDRNIMDFIDYAKNQYSLGNLYSRRRRAGDLDLALYHMERGKGLLEEVHASTHILMLNIETFLCGHLYLRGLYPQALASGISTLDREREFGDNDSAKDAKTVLCQYLAYTYQACGNYREASAMLERAMDYARSCTRRKKEKEKELREEMRSVQGQKYKLRRWL